MTADVLRVVGEAVADVVRTRDGLVTTLPGGSAANVAVGLARLGQQVTLTTQLGADPRGDLIRRHLEGAGVTVDCPHGADASTPTAYATLDASGAAHYVFDTTWVLEPRLDRLGGGHVHVGSFPAFLGGAPDRLAESLEAHHQAGTTSFDPNVRPSLMPRRDVVLARFERLLGSLDVVKASDEDIAWLYPGETTVDVLARWLDAGVGLAVVTRGADGAVAASPERLTEIAARPARVVDTVGAGDSFMAALLDGLMRSGLLGEDARPLRQADSGVLTSVLDRSARAAAITVSRAGAAPPTGAELEPVGRSAAG